MTIISTEEKPMQRLPKAISRFDDVAAEIQKGVDAAAETEPTLTERMPIAAETVVISGAEPERDELQPALTAGAGISAVETPLGDVPLTPDLAPPYAPSITEAPAGPDFESARAITAAMATPFTQVLCRVVNGGDRWTPIEEFIAQRIRNLTVAYVNACRDGGVSPIMVNASIELMLREMEDNLKAALRGGAKP